ncbi:hypothetical protein [Polycladomyces subterraneus]|jgi:hypothetical protein|nr:hypothetical protein [Polycladomyces subterraneus]
MLMAATTRSRNEWTFSLLEIRSENRILEVGYGPGVGIFQSSEGIQEGKIVGIDPLKRCESRRNGATAGPADRGRCV